MIIAALWRMAEVKLYGFSQESTVDSLAALVLSVVLVECIFSFFEEDDTYE